MVQADSLCSDASSTANSGSLFDSGGSSGSYGNNDDCSFLIQPDNGGVITLSFTSFRYENSYDFLRIYDGTTTNDTLLGSFTGSSVPSNLEASSGSMLIVQDTDGSVTEFGFSASWTADANPEYSLCDDASSAAGNGQLTDPGGASGNYGNREACNFLIQPNTSSDITFSFDSFRYETNYDYLRIYDGTSTGDTLLGSYTGSGLPADVTATSGAMLIRHTTDGSVVSTGFSGSWTTVASPPQACPDESVGDNFPNVSYSQNSGSERWTTDWTEIGESDGASTGIARVNGSNCSGGNCLRLGQPGGASTWNNIGVQREADLSSATSATLTFNYYTGRNRGSETVVVAVSSNGGASWTNLQSYTIVGTSFSANAQQFDITPYVAANFRLRFLSSGSNATIGMYIDDIAINYAVTCPVPVPIADWHLDELAYNSTAGEVSDSSASGFDGTGQGDTSTIASGQVCRAASFDGNGDYFSEPNFADTLQTTSSLSYWIRTGETGSNSPWLSPSVTGVEESCCENDIFWGWINATGQIAVGPGNDNGTHARSTSAVSDEMWHHIVHTRDADTGELNTYFDGALQGNTTGATGTITTAFSSVGRQENTRSSGVFFNGHLDEILVFDEVLQANQVQSIYASQLAGMNYDGSDRVCNLAVASQFVLEHDNSGIHCTAELITLTATDDYSVVVPSYIGTVTLTTQTGKGTWTLVSGNGTFNDATANDGVATYAFDPADNGEAQFSLDYKEGTSPIDIEAYQSNDTTLRDDDSEGLLSFAPSGFVLTANALSNPPPNPIDDPLPTQTAGNNITVHLTAYGVTPTDATCGVIESYTGNRTVGFWTDHNNPNTSTVTATINGATTGASAAAAQTQTINFTAGQASVSAKYKDTGQLSLQAQDTASFEHAITGATNAFVSLPANFAITQITDTSNNANPAAATMAGTGFIPSGTNFRVVVQAQDAEGSVTPSYGLESAAEGVRLRSAGLVAPVGGRNGSSGDVTGGSTFARTGAGTFTSSTISFDEAGIIQLAAEVLDGDYLGSGNLIGTTSGNVGRFYPASFVMTSSNVTPACASFTYQDQPQLGLNYVLQARNLAGLILQNYDGTLISSANLASVAWAAENSDSGTDLGSRLSAALPAWVSGSVSFSDPAARFTKAASPDGPYQSLQLGIVLNDLLDGVELQGNDINPTTSGDCTAAGNCTAKSLGASTSVLYGRLVVLPSNAPETSVLDVALASQYWDGSAFRQYPADNCSTYASANAALSAYTGDLSNGDTNLIAPLGIANLASGSADPAQPLRLSAPGAGNTGSAQLTLDVDSWLEFPWSGPAAQDPSALIQFGRYRGHDRIVYWNELTR